MTLHQITSSIRATKGEVLLCGPTSFGYIIRAVVGGKTCRIITPASTKKVLPLEPGTETHLITDEPSFQTWLNSLIAI
jgi:hypothetical protein